MKIVIFCQAIFFCIAVVFTCFSVNERFFENKVRACLMISKWLFSDFRHQKLYQKEICQKENFLSTFPLFLIKDLTSRDWKLMDTQHCFGFLLVLLLNMEHLTGMVSIIRPFKVRLLIKLFRRLSKEAFQESTMKVNCLTVLKTFFIQLPHISATKKVVMKVQMMELM